MALTAQQKLDKEVTDEVIRNCVLTRTRQISRVMTAIYDQELRPYGINSSQFSLLVLIVELATASRSDLGRRNHQDRTTLTRNLQPLILQGLVTENVPESGRRRPLSITEEGKALLRSAAPAWSIAQAKAKALMGESGVSAILSIARDLPHRTS